MQQPSRYITQCGTLTVLFSAIILICAVNCLALTTFGKSSNPAPTTKPLGKFLLFPKWPVTNKTEDGLESNYSLFNNQNYL